MADLILAATGHRPDKLNNEWEGRGPYSLVIRTAFKALLDHHKPSKVISGMALGVDTLWTEAALRHKTPVHAAIPCPEQDRFWSEEGQNRYRWLRNQCSEEIIIHPRYHRGVMKMRNQWMVNNCGRLIAVWDGRTRGGTFNTIAYAFKVGKPVDVYLMERNIVKRPAVAVWNKIAAQYEGQFAWPPKKGQAYDPITLTPYYDATSDTHFRLRA
jgi:uncharacterized phage-like protein YoqJ